jgi:heme/copper-type cytochrome/quinol oxidase subunit 1
MFTLVKEFDIWLDVNKMMTIAAIVGGAAQLLFLWNFFYSIFKGKKSEQNPWQSNTLEWSAPVEHLHGNWPKEIPTVYRGPYEYSRPDREDDYFPQYVPDESDKVETGGGDTKSEPKRKSTKKEEVVENVMFSAIKRVFGWS